MNYIRIVKYLVCVVLFLWYILFVWYLSFLDNWIQIFKSIMISAMIVLFIVFIIINLGDDIKDRYI